MLHSEKSNWSKVTCVSFVSLVLEEQTEKVHNLINLGKNRGYQERLESLTSGFRILSLRLGTEASLLNADPASPPSAYPQGTKPRASPTIRKPSHSAKGSFE